MRIVGFINIFILLFATTFAYADPAQTGRWTKVWGEPYAGGLGGQSDTVMDMTYDGQGHLYLTGCYNSVAFGVIWSRSEACNFFISKMDTDGNEIWFNVLDAGWNKDDKGVHIAMDSIGNIIVSGSTNGKDFSGGDVFEKVNFLAKYDTDGNQMWISFFGNVTDSATQFVIDEVDNIYVAGSTTANDPDPNDSTAHSDAVLYYFDTDGNQVWRQSYFSDTMDSGLVAYDKSSRRTYMVVNSYDPQSAWPGYREISLRLLRPDGSIWITKEYGASSTNMGVTAVQFVPGGIVIAGAGPTKLFTPDEVQSRYMPYFVAKLSNSTYTGQFGSLVWRDRYGVCDGCMYINDMHVDKYNRIHITGNYGKNASGNITGGKPLTDWGNSIFYSMYNAAGDRFTVDQMGATGVRDYGGAVTTDEDGNAFLAGGIRGDLNGVAAPGAHYYSSDFYLTRNEL